MRRWLGLGAVVAVAACGAHRPPATSSAEEVVVTEVSSDGSRQAAPKGEPSASPDAAPAEPAAPERAIKYAERTEIDFEDIEVSGELVKPSGALILDRKKSAFEPLEIGELASPHAHAGFVDTAADRHSTFAIDVDTGAFTMARRALREGRRPHPPNVRVEEFVNAQPYDWSGTRFGPLEVASELVVHPEDDDLHLLTVALQTDENERRDVPVRLTFLVDVSCSMRPDDKLPLAKHALHHLVGSLGAEDTVAIATYAGVVREVLAPTPTTRAAAIHQAIDRLKPGGGTRMHGGLSLAYDLASRRAVPGIENRVIVLSDGDANVGPSTWEEMVKVIEPHAAEGITLSTIGFGTGNYRDTAMERLADLGDGNYAYIDDRNEAERVFGRDLSATLKTVARDVKVQVEFDPERVTRYRLLGYENRAIADADFRNDDVDAGEIGAGHTVTAVYEVALAGDEGALGEVYLRWMPPGARSKAREDRVALPDRPAIFEAASPDAQIAFTTAAFAEKLRDPAAGPDWKRLAKAARSAHRGYVEDDELVELITRAGAIYGGQARR